MERKGGSGWSRRRVLAGVAAAPALGAGCLLATNGSKGPAFGPAMAAALSESDPAGSIASSGQPVRELDRLILDQDFTQPLSFRTGGPSHAGLKAGRGEITCLYHYGQWAWNGKPPGMEIPSCESFIVDVSDPRIRALGLDTPALYEVGAAGLKLKNIRTPEVLKIFTDKPWSTVNFTWQHSLGVKPPFFIEAEARIPDVAGFWPALWMLGADRHAVQPFDRAPHYEIDFGELFTRWPRASVAAIHYMPEGGGRQTAVQDFGDRHVDFTRGFNAFAAHVRSDKVVDFFINRRRIWTTPVPASARSDQFLYPILSMGAGTPDVDAGVPDASAPDEVVFAVKSLRIWGGERTPVFRG